MRRAGSAVAWKAEAAAAVGCCRLHGPVLLVRSCLLLRAPKVTRCLQCGLH